MTASRKRRKAPQARFAVVGAGIAGLTCARDLAKQGIRVWVFERGSAVGGRLGCLTTDGGDYDAGAQYLTVQNEAFANEVRSWVGADLLRTWEGNLADLSNGQGVLLPPATSRYVGIPSMQSIAGFIARGLNVVLDTTVTRIARTGTGWMLYGADDVLLDPVGYDGLVLAMPSVHALPLVRAETDFGPLLEPVRWDACWTACLALARPSGIEFDGAFINDDPILAWAACETSKPMRRADNGVAERWLLQARPSWSNNFADLSAEEAARWMQRAFAARLARPLAQKSCFALRWGAALAAEPLVQPFLWDANRAIGLAGDWCGGARVETAFLSGAALARTISP
jgi:predicted NAD/FAD-dependent oxidoreductase